MKDNKTTVTIKQVGYTYVFSMAPMCAERENEVRDNLQAQLKEGLVVLPPWIKLESVEPHLEALAE